MTFNESFRNYKNSLTNLALFESSAASSLAALQEMERSQEEREVIGGGPPLENHNRDPAVMVLSPQFTTPKRRVSYSNTTKGIDKGAGSISYRNSTEINNHSSRENIIVQQVANNSHHPNLFSPFDIAMDTPFKDLQSSPCHSPSPFKNEIRLAEPAFQLNELVDGLCTLPNGTKRWFPGKIIEVKGSNNSSFMYTILYNDGEINRDKKEEDLRKTKTRKSERRSSSSSSSSSSTTSSASITVVATTKKPVRTNSPPKIDTSHKVPFFSPQDMLLSPYSECTMSPSGPSVTALPPVMNPNKSMALSKQSQHEIDGLFGDNSRRSSDQGLLSMSFVKQVEETGEDDDMKSEESEEDRVYEIPSIFDNHRQVHKRPTEGIAFSYLLYFFSFLFCFSLFSLFF
jgi:hypothetical protein